MIHAYHMVSGDPSEEARRKCSLLLRTDAKCWESLIYQRTVNAFIGLLCGTSVNIKTDDLICGTTGVLKMQCLDRNVINNLSHR